MASRNQSAGKKTVAKRMAVAKKTAPAPKVDANKAAAAPKPSPSKAKATPPKPIPTAGKPQVVSKPAVAPKPVPQAKPAPVLSQTTGTISKAGPATPQQTEERRKAATRKFFARLRSLEAIVGADLRKRGSLVLMQAVDQWYSEAVSATATDVTITNAAKAVIGHL
jgi:hypothetical protein